MPKVIRLHQPMGADGLQIDDIPLTHPPENTVRIRVSACCLNWGDVDYMQDNYTQKLADLPARIGHDSVGVVDAVGNNIDPSWIGKRVCSLPYFSGPYGEHGEFAIIHHDSIVEAYKDFSDIEAASVMGQYTTAYFGLIKQGNINKDSKILISAATSSAGIAAIKIANMIGATTVCTTRDKDNKSFLNEMGASEVLISEDENFPSMIREVTCGDGVDIVFDPINGRFFNQYLYSLADNAKIILYGGIDDSTVELDLEAQLELTKRNATLRFFSVQNYADQMDEAVKFIESGFDSGDLMPVIDKTFAFEDFQDAYAYMASKRDTYGKIVLTINQ